MQKGANATKCTINTLNNTNIKHNHKDKKKGCGEKEKGAQTFTPPSIDEVAAYFTGIGFRTEGEAPQEAETFCNYYESKGWTVGNSTMKNWKAAANNWAKRDKKKETSSRSADVGVILQPTTEDEYNEWYNI